MRTLRRDHLRAASNALCSKINFWGSWGSKASPKTRSASVFSKIIPPGAKGGKPFDQPSAAVPKGSMSMAEALNPSRVEEAIKTLGESSPDSSQQMLIDAGLELLENAKKINLYSAAQIQALDNVTQLVFSETQSVTMPVYKQLQLIADALFTLNDGSESNEVTKPLLSVLAVFMPPDLAVVFESVDMPRELRAEEDRLAVIGCCRLALGEPFEDACTRFDGVVKASSILIDRASGADVLGRAKRRFQDDVVASGSTILISLNEALHEAVSEIEASESRANTNHLMERLFGVLLEQLPQLAANPVFHAFAINGASQLRLQCEYAHLLAKLFAAFDAEQTGKISYELLKGSISRVAGEEKAKALLANAHPDDEGNVDYPVLIRVIRNSK